MKIDPKKLQERIRSRAKNTSGVRYRVIAIGLDKNGKFIGITSNRPRITGVRDWHAEEILLHNSPPNLKTILIARVGKTGDFLPIEPCKHCTKLGNKYNVIIKTLEEY